MREPGNMNPEHHSRILILGIAGMLGHTLFRQLAANSMYEVVGAARSLDGIDELFSQKEKGKIRLGIEADTFHSITSLLKEFRPDVVINCIGIIKQLEAAKDPLISIAINALFPHRIAQLCKEYGSRMIHISTDCIFSGLKGNYTEADFPDAADLYGRSKFLGEVDYPHAVTLRTSIIGHELKGKHGLVEWFLAQQGMVQGFTKAIYTGFPTIEILRIMMQFVIPNRKLSGIYHVASEAISKYDLLMLIADRYGKQITILPSEDFFCNRSLDSRRFRDATGYTPPSWPELVEKMHQDYIDNYTQ
jgi:dTDP-4-dehydrorhamnose reductase